MKNKRIEQRVIMFTANIAIVTLLVLFTELTDSGNTETFTETI